MRNYPKHCRKFSATGLFGSGAIVLHVVQSQPGPLPEDGRQVWFASDERLNAPDPDSGERMGRWRSPPMPAWLPMAGICYRSPGRSSARSIPKAATFWQPFPRSTGTILGLPGLAWAEGSLWVGQHRGCRIHEVDPETGKVLHSIDSNRFVTGVAWSTARSGTVPGRTTTATSGTSILPPARTGMAGDAAGHRRLGTGFRWRRAVLLWRQQRQAEGGSAQAGSGRDLGLRALPREPGSWRRT